MTKKTRRNRPWPPWPGCQPQPEKGRITKKTQVNVTGNMPADVSTAFLKYLEAKVNTREEEAFKAFDALLTEWLNLIGQRLDVTISIELKKTSGEA